MEVMQVVDKGIFVNVLEKLYMCIEKPTLITN